MNFYSLSHSLAVQMLSTYALNHCIHFKTARCYHTKKGLKPSNGSVLDTRRRNSEVTLRLIFQRLLFKQGKTGLFLCGLIAPLVYLR